MSYVVRARVAEDTKHNGDIECVLFHGQKIYTGGDDGEIRVWDSDLKLLAHVKAHQYAVYHLAVNKDASLLYSCSNDGTICTWRLPGLEAGPQLLGHPDSVRKLRFSSQGHLFSGDEQGNIRMWKNGEADAGHGFESLGEEIWDLVLDGDLILTARDRDVVVSQVKETSSNVQCKATFPGRAPLCVVQDKVYFVDRAGKDITVHHNAGKKYAKITDMKGHDKIVNAMTSSCCGKFLYTGGYDNTVRVWNLEDHKCTAKVELDFLVNTITAAPGGTLFAAGGNSMLVKIVAS